MDPTDHWDGVYSTKAHDSVSWFEPEPLTSLELVEACGIDPGDPVIDVGGGASALVDGLLARGYGDVWVLDVSGHALEAARRRLGGRANDVTWQVADVTKWVPPRTFRLWHDRAVLHFLRSDLDRSAYRSAAERAVEPGGWVVIATFAAEGPTRCSGLDVQRSDAEDLLDTLGPGFELERAFTRAHITPSGATQAFQWVVLRRRPAAAAG